MYVHEMCWQAVAHPAQSRLTPCHNPGVIIDHHCVALHDVATFCVYQWPKGCVFMEPTYCMENSHKSVRRDRKNVWSHSRLVIAQSA